jgi:SAM-dependent methyltransferase
VRGRARRALTLLKALVEPRPLSTTALGSRVRARPPAAPSHVLGELSDRLRAFTEELPIERRSILEFVASCARELPPGTTVLDAGAGDAPYRELFAHCEYRTTDWEESVHPGARRADIIAPLDALPIADASFDAALCTQVLEHVENPRAVLGELHRVLRSGGGLWLTVPLVWPLHEEPFDFYRYTQHGLVALLARTGFVEIEVGPRNGYFTTLAQLMGIARQTVGWHDDGRDAARARVYEDLERLAIQLERSEHLDHRRIFPLGYHATARRAK